MSAEDWTKKYFGGIDVEELKDRLSKDREGILTLRYSRIIFAFQTLCDRIYAILAEYPDIPAYHYPLYYAYGYEILSKARIYGTRTFEKYKRRVYNKYLRKGLKAEVLTKISTIISKL